MSITPYFSVMHTINTKNLIKASRCVVCYMSDTKITDNDIKTVLQIANATSKFFRMPHLKNALLSQENLH